MKGNNTMNKITKIVTREEDLFIARDSKEFEDEDEQKNRVIKLLKEQ